MNIKQKTVLSIALPLLVGAVIFPPHQESGTMSGNIDGHAFDWPLEDSWVLRPLVAPKEMDITVAGGAAKSHREYAILPWVWLGAVLAILVLGGGLVFLFRSEKKPTQDRRAEHQGAPGQARDHRADSSNAQQRVGDQESRKRKASSGGAQFRVVR